MKNPDELRREIEALGERISLLSAASLRSSASLDFNTVLQEIAESARALTGARYGGIQTRGLADSPVNAGGTLAARGRSVRSRAWQHAFPAG